MSATAWGRGGKLAWVWGVVYWDVKEEEGDWISDSIAILGGLVTTSFMLAPRITYGTAGIVTRAIVTNPIAQIVTGAVVSGAIVSNELDPDRGYDNYIGFISGGEVGEPDINYWSGDPNDSGYFNIPKNLEVIWKHYKDSKRTQRVMGMPGKQPPPQLRRGIQAWD